jgi:hypothetical protein
VLFPDIEAKFSSGEVCSEESADGSELKLEDELGREIDGGERGRAYMIVRVYIN